MSNQLAVLEKLEVVPFFTKGENLETILDRIEKEALEHVPDVSTLKGRNAIKANITLVTSSKTYLEKEGKKLADEYKLIPKVIDATRKSVKERLADVIVKCRVKLNEWEEEQKQIKADALAKEEADKILKQIDDVWDFAHSRLNLFNFGELMVIDHNADVQKKRDDAIAKEAADKATKEAEEKAEAKIKAAKDAAQKVIDDAKDKADADALKVKQDAEDKAKALELKVTIEACHEVGLMMNADFDRKVAAKIKQDADDKKDAEDKKIADDLAKKKASTENRHKVHTAMKGYLVSMGVDGEVATKIVLGMGDDKMPYVKVNY